MNEFYSLFRFFYGVYSVSFQQLTALRMQHVCETIDILYCIALYIVYILYCIEMIDILKCNPKEKREPLLFAPPPSPSLAGPGPDRPKKGRDPIVPGTCIRIRPTPSN